MAYTTEAQIRQEAGFQNNSNVTSATVTDYQTRAFNTVKGYAARRYSLTQLSGSLFTSSQAESVLKQCECLLAAGWLLLNQYAGQPMGEANGKEKVDRAMGMLEDIAAGKLKLLDTNSSEFTSDIPSSGGVSPSLTAPPRTESDPSTSERKFSVDTKW